MKKLSKRFVTTTFLLWFAIPAAACLSEEPPALVGMWKLESIEMRGKKQSPGRFPLSWHIDEDSIRIRFGGRQASRHACEIDESVTPHHFSWTLSRGDRKFTTRAIYEIEGDRLKVCTLRGSEDRPTSFETEGEDQKNYTVFRFTREDAE